MRERRGIYSLQVNKAVLRRVVHRITMILSFVVVFGVFWGFKLTGITLAGDAFCGFEEHHHDETCMPSQLICDQTDSPGHVHDDSCLQVMLICEQDERPVHFHDRDCHDRELICTEPEGEGHIHSEECREWILVCGLEEQEGHTHREDCFTDTLICTDEEPDHVHGPECCEQTLTCVLEEQAGHEHTEDCFQPGDDFICGLEESEGHTHGTDCYLVLGDVFLCGGEQTAGHVHTDECYATGIGCGMTESEVHIHSADCYEFLAECPLEEHIHQESCYSNINADLENSDDWELSVEGVDQQLTTAEMLVSVARTQLGYRESELNFEVDLHGVRRGITRYGQWYGNPYGDWSAMFVSFCLHYAGAQELPANAGPESMRLEWEEAGLYNAAANSVPKIGNLIFLKEEPGLRGEFLQTIPSAAFGTDAVRGDAALPVEETAEPAVTVGIISDMTEEGIVIIQGNLDDAVSERTIPYDDPVILGYGVVLDQSPYTVMAVPTGELSNLADTINFSTGIFTGNRSFILYTQRGDNYYAVDGNGNAVPVWIQDGSVYSDTATPNAIRWTVTRSNNRYVIQNLETGLYLSPYYNSASDSGVINRTNRNTPMTASGTGAKLINNNIGVRLNTNGTAFEATRTQSEASVFYFGVAETCTVWLDGSNGGITSLGGAQSQSYQVTAPSQLTLPTQWPSPVKYSYKLRGWYDITHDLYYAPGQTVTITENTVFYADWIADTYDIGQYNAQVADTVSTNSFITTQLFDYNYLFNVLSADSTGSISASSHSETWAIVQREAVDFENRESLDFIFLDYGDQGTLEYPNNRREGVNNFPGAGIVTPGIYNERIGEALFATDDHIPGKVYLGTADHLFQIMTDPSDPYYGYYYYDSARNAASYNQSDGRFYVYDYLEATSAELSESKSDFLPLNSPYANTNGKQPGTYKPSGMPTDLTHYVYDAKYSDSSSSVDRVSTNYAFGMKTEISFYLPNRPGEGGNQDLNGNDMRFMFSGDDDLWILVDGKLALDIGGIHQAESGEINFSTGEVLVQGDRDDKLSAVVAALEPGEHTLTMMYLERGGSHSNCAIYFNLAPRFRLSIQKEDVLTRDVLNGAEFSVFRDLECTIPAELWENEESHLNGDPATNIFTVKNGSAHMWGMGAGNTYYIKETRPPDKTDYGFPNGIIRMVLDKRGAATYSVMILDGGDGISGGFTVHGFRVDEETQQAYIIATNAPHWVQDVTSVEARKVWSDGKDHSADAVTVYLTIHDPDGTVRRLQEATLSDETQWQHLWDNLPKFYEDGTPIQYGVEEAYVSGYYSKVEQVSSYDVTTYQWKEVTSLENGKTYLLKNGNNYLSTRNWDQDTGFMWVNEATAKESDLAQWSVTKIGNGFKLTNLAGQTITLYYNGGSPTDFYAYSGNSLPSQATQELSYSVSGKQIRIFYDAPNNRDYYIRNRLNSSQKFETTTRTNEAQLFTPVTRVGSTTSGPVQGEHAYKITNTPLERETSLTVQKQWYNHLGDDPSLYEKAQVTVRLLANGKDTGRTVTLSLKNGWTDAFRGLPYEDDNGNVIEYTIEESWYSKDWLPEYGPVNSSGGSTPSYSTTVTNVYRWGHGVQLPATGTFARMMYMLCGGGIMLLTLVYGTVSRRKRERRMK